MSWAVDEGRQGLIFSSVFFADTVRLPGILSIPSQDHHWSASARPCTLAQVAWDASDSACHLGRRLWHLRRHRCHDKLQTDIDWLNCKPTALVQLQIISRFSHHFTKISKGICTHIVWWLGRDDSMSRTQVICSSDMFKLLFGMPRSHTTRNTMRVLTILRDMRKSWDGQSCLASNRKSVVWHWWYIGVEVYYCPYMSISFERIPLKRGRGNTRGR